MTLHKLPERGRVRRPNWNLLLDPATGGQHPLIHAGATPEHIGREVAGIAYLATPYSKVVLDADGLWDQRLSLDASARAARASAALARHGVTALSPIVQTAEMCHCSSLSARDPGALDPLDAAFWTRWCAPLLAAARAVIVPDIPGWDQSDGIWAEVVSALGCNLPVYVYDRGAA